MVKELSRVVASGCDGRETERTRRALAIPKGSLGAPAETADALRLSNPLSRRRAYRLLVDSGVPRMR